MYNYIPFFIGAILGVLGIVMSVNPKMCTKETFRDNAAMVAKSRKSGILFIVLGVIMIILGLFTAKII